MPSRIANESEHRRGLVLCATLPAVLLLLLSLILLVLGDRLVRADTARARAETELTKLRDLLPPGTSDLMAGALARIEELEKAVADLKKENAQLRTELSEKAQKLGALEPLISLARAIDPNDP